ncbi:MAG TPA: Mbeg1-like protein [Polyangiaceae bacterium]|nr:Mbeg1-like protein [Polyangiaceae bacterium]
MSLSEYALLIVAIILISALGWRLLGQNIRTTVECAAGFGGGNCSSNNATAGSNAAAGGDGSGSSSGAPGGAIPKALAADSTPFDQQVYGQNPKPIDQTFADLAADVYHDGNGQPVDGFTRLDNAQLEAANIDPTRLNDPSSGFKAAIYTDGQGHYVLAFKGSQSANDWKTNFKQGLGFDTAQYGEAVALAKDAKLAFQDNLVITGHSLGGGLASTASAATNTPAVIFNPAGVNNETLERNHLDPGQARATAENGMIRRYEVKGEILSGLQEHAPTGWVMPDAMGHKISLPDPHPLSFWQKLNPYNDVKHAGQLHGMDSVNDSLHKNPPWK